MDETEGFEKAWNSFISKVKGRLKTISEKGNFDYERIKLTINKLKLDWRSDEAIEGRWLSEYTEKHPDKGKEIEILLTESMRVQPAEKEKNISPLFTHAMPAAGAILGFSSSHIRNENIFVQGASAVIPAAVLFAAGKHVSNELKYKQTKNKMEFYIHQLESYKKGVCQIIAE